METNTRIDGLDPMVGIEDLAAYLGLPVKTLYKWRQDGTGPASVRISRHVRYFVSDVSEWLQHQRERSAHHVDAAR